MMRASTSESTPFRFVDFLDMDKLGKTPITKFPVEVIGHVRNALPSSGPVSPRPPRNVRCK